MKGGYNFSFPTFGFTFLENCSWWLMQVSAMVYQLEWWLWEDKNEDATVTFGMSHLRMKRWEHDEISHYYLFFILWPESCLQALGAQWIIYYLWKIRGRLGEISASTFTRAFFVFVLCAGVDCEVTCSFFSFLHETCPSWFTAINLHRNTWCLFE